MVSFKDPWFFLLLLLIPLLVYRHLRSRRGALRFSSVDALKKISPSWTVRGMHVLLILQCLTILFLVTALARPQKGKAETKISTEGIDIMLAVDVSGSMLAEDFQVGGEHHNRLYAVKQVVRDFIKKRPNDRIGIVIFAGRPYTLCPLTLDHGWLIQQLERAEVGMIEDGTAIGSGIAVCTNHLRESNAKSKVIILLTDGRNNAGRVDPITAAEAASALGIKIYTIGAGTRGLAPFPTRDFFGNKVYRQVKIEIDEDTLRKIADKTSGMYFRATDTDSLQKTYKKIDEMEKTKIMSAEYLEYREFYPYLLLSALVTLILWVILSNTRLRRLP